jgi:hypothetical protein
MRRGDRRSRISDSAIKRIRAPESAASTAGAEGRRAKGTEGGHLEHLGDFGPLPTDASGLAVR